MMRLYYRFATKLQASSTSNSKDSAGRRLGVKKFHNQEVFPNDVIVKQRGFKWKPGNNIIVGRDHTFHAKCEGVVKFERKPYNSIKNKKIVVVHVEPKEIRNQFNRRPPLYQYHPELRPDLQFEFNFTPFKIHKKEQKIDLNLNNIKNVIYKVKFQSKDRGNKVQNNNQPIQYNKQILKNIQKGQSHSKLDQHQSYKYYLDQLDKKIKLQV